MDNFIEEITACTAKYSDVKGFRHCPYCGAFMDGGNSNGKE